MKTIDLEKLEVVELVLDPRWQQKLARKLGVLKGLVSRLRTGPGRWTRSGDLERSLLDELESVVWIGQALLRCPRATAELELELAQLDVRHRAIVLGTFQYFAEQRREGDEEE